MPHHPELFENLEGKGAYQDDRQNDNAADHDRQPDVDPTHHNSGGGQAFTFNHAIALFDFGFRHVTGNQSRDGTNQGNNKEAGGTANGAEDGKN